MSQPSAAAARTSDLRAQGSDASLGEGGARQALSHKSDTVGSATSSSSGGVGAADNAPVTSEIAKQIRADKSGAVAQRFFSLQHGDMPLVVLVNPKSGGKQVYDMMELNPSTGKPYGATKALETHGHMPNLSVLVCGGDGTVGWVLCTIDEMGLNNLGIKVGTIPLGTGNDLARALKFGAGYSGQSVLKVLAPLADAGCTPLDRWEIQSEVTGSDARKARYSVGDVALEPPQLFWNNYFSVGSDAHTALQFHLRREKNPAKYNSQWRNKLTYGVVGGMETFHTKFRKLSQEIELVCDGKDYTALIREKKIVALAFLNIHSYGAGTQPWGTKRAIESKGFSPPRMDDGKLEVLGFWPWSFPMGQARVGHAWRICQCSQADLTLLSANPMQIDGEPCYLAASKIRLRHRNQALMLCHRQGRYRNLPPVLAVGAATPDVAPPESTPLYEVTIDPSALTASRLHRLGNVTLNLGEGGGARHMDTMSLTAIRSLVDVELGREFRTDLHPSEYVFLRFERFDDGGDDGGAGGSGGAEGRYVMISVASEGGILCRGFMFPPDGVRAGLFITRRLPPTGTVASSGKAASQELLQATSSGDWRRAIELLDAGVPPTVVDADGDTLMHLAAAQNMLELLSFLISRGVDCDACNKSGNTPLHQASERGCAVAVTILLEAGATASAVNADGKTPMDIAQSETVRKALGERRRAHSGGSSPSSTPTPRGVGSRGASPVIDGALQLNDYTQV